MNKPTKFIITTIIVFSLLFNSTTAFAGWGVDENGKYSFDKVTVVIKEEYSQNPESVIGHLQSNYSTEGIKILSESTDSTIRQPLILLVNLPATDENGFKRIVENLSEDQYIEYVLKDYYMCPANSYSGDVDQDGKITTEDARTVLKYASYQIEIKTETEKFLADIDRDGTITTQDAIYILKLSCGIEITN